jgi:hypothetical protein
MININFLASHRSLKNKQKEKDKKLFRISSYVLGAVLFVTVAAFAAKFWINLRIKNSEETIAQYRNSILAQEGTELDYLIFVNKLSAISDIYKRSDKQEAMNYFADIFANSADIVGMSYQQEAGGLILQLSMDNVFKLEEAMDIIDSTEVRKKYPDVKKTVLNRTDAANYKLSLQLELKQE